MGNIEILGGFKMIRVVCLTRIQKMLTQYMRRLSDKIDKTDNIEVKLKLADMVVNYGRCINSIRKEVERLQNKQIKVVSEKTRYFD